MKVKHAGLNFPRDMAVGFTKLTALNADSSPFMTDAVRYYRINQQHIKWFLIVELILKNLRRYFPKSMQYKFSSERIGVGYAQSRTSA